MSDEARLARAMAPATPKPRDEAFIVAVLERAEAERYRQNSARAWLRVAGYTTPLAGLAALMLTAVPLEELIEGLVGSICLAAFVMLARRAVNA